VQDLQFHPFIGTGLPRLIIGMCDVWKHVHRVVMV
jgi:hypothetical protein